MNRNKPQIGLLGCGWLGFPLAIKLLAEGFTVKGSTTSLSKFPELEENGIVPFSIVLTEEGVKGAILEFLNEVDILIIAIPPGLRNSKEVVLSKSYFHKIEKLVPYLELSKVKKILFVSSTSVYDDTNTTVTEATLPNPVTESGKQLLDVEKLLQKQTHFKTTIVRFGGLIGTDRHPIKMLAGRENLDNPEAVINLIHKEDCIGIILKIIEKEVWQETFNAVTPFHPTRKEYYQRKAKDQNLPLPSFTTTEPSTGKLVSSTKIEKILGYSFIKKTL